MVSKDIYLFGSGRLGELLYGVIKDELPIKGFIDNNPEKIGISPNGIPIYSLDSVNDIERIYIIISANQHNNEIYSQLTAAGFKHGVNFVYYKEFFRKIFLEKNILLQGYVEIYITDRCTLNCRHCGSMIYAINQKRDRDISTIQNDIDAYFAVVDKVIEMRILGGEPFLHEHLDKIIDYIGANYRNRIEGLKIVSNGTVVPNKKMLQILRQYSAEVDISEYPQDKIKNVREKLKTAFQEGNVTYKIMNMDHWVDLYGDPTIRKMSDNEAKKMFRSCNYGCRVLYEGKLYFCSIDRAAQTLGIIKGDNDDYLSLTGTMRDDLRKQLIEFDLGNVKKGCVSFCKNCYGGINVNKRYIPVAQQA